MSGDTPAAKQRGTASSATGPGGAETQVSSRAGNIRDRYLQLKPLGFQELPFHPDFGTDDGFLDISSFLGRVLIEAKEWHAESWEVVGKHRFGTGELPRATCSEVKKLAKQVEQDTWFGRKSKHLDKRPTNWDVLDYALRRDHSVHEAEYTPNIFDQKEILVWQTPSLDMAAASLGFGNVDMLVTNMYHNIPSPLCNRVFTVLVLTAKRTDLDASCNSTIKNESIIVQLPVDLSTFPDHVKARANHTIAKDTIYQPHDEHLKKRNHRHVGRRLVAAHYASVEKLTFVPRTTGISDSDGSVGETTWTMSTTSNANGSIPKRLQDWMIPGEIVKDIGFVYDWIGKNQQGTNWPPAP